MATDRKGKDVRPGQRAMADVEVLEVFDDWAGFVRIAIGGNRYIQTFCPASDLCVYEVSEGDEQRQTD